MKKLLIVEDNEDMRLLYKRLFRREKDWAVYESETAENALEMTPGLLPDLILVDISLPGMSGLELSQKIRRSYPLTKILIVTGHDPDRYFEAAKQAGANDLVSKEIGPGLVRMCRDLLDAPDEAGKVKPPDDHPKNERR
jgi:CheY-like chemotaxis protein